MELVFNELRSALLHFLSSQNHLSCPVTSRLYVFFDTSVPSVEDLPDSGVYTPDHLPVGRQHIDDDPLPN